MFVSTTRCFFLMVMVVSAPMQSLVHAQTTQDLKRMSLEELLDIPVTTLSRGPEATTAVAAALHVITEEDIRRSGANSLPEALRLVPGVQVARINAGIWSIGIRGFADRLARSMLVLMDGRAVYSPLFAGTYWEVQDTLLEDIARIEVIRGPGGTLWGANAVNGIVNIITKPAAETQGILATFAAGSTERAQAAFRYGARAGDAWNYRVFGKVFDRSSHHHVNNANFDGLRLGMAGFRADWAPGTDRRVTLQGDWYDARLGQRPTVTTYTPPYAETRAIDAPLSGGHVLARWSGPAFLGSPFQLQTFYARTAREELPVTETRDTIDVDFQQSLRRWNRHHVTWGAGYRMSSGLIEAIEPTAFIPPRRTDNLYTAFVQDDMTLVADRLRFTLGAKVERNDYSGGEVQPSGRLAWTPNASHTAWWSVTRAVRTPSRVETDYTTISLNNPAIPAFVRLQPNPAFVAEELVAYEAGYRIRPISSAYVSVAAFYNVHDDLLSTELLPSFMDTTVTPARLIVPVTFGNTLDGRTYGFAVSGETRPSPWWRLTASYSHFRGRISRQEGSRDVTQERRYEGGTPRHQTQVTSSVDIGPHLSVDAFGRYISSLSALTVPSYWTMNVRVAVDLTPELEVSVVGQDLADDHHAEWSGGVEISRSAYVKLTWRR